jgi:hypothetical protein
MPVVVVVVMARRSWATAAARPSGWVKIAEPATSSSAPACTAPGAVAAEIPPSTSMETGSPVPSMRRAGLGDLALHGLEVGLAAEAGIDGHHEEDVDLCLVVGAEHGRDDGRFLHSLALARLASMASSMAW